MSGELKLLQCKEGMVGTIAELATSDRRILGKLMSLGILPGIQFHLLRCQPGLVIQTGYTKVALDRELAAFICVAE